MNNKKMILIVLSLLLFQNNVYTWIYLWETPGEYSTSCCLHMHGVDICNPNMPCTRFAHKDLSGILDYVLRLLATDKAQLEPHHKILLEAKKHLKSAIANQFYAAEYHLDRHDSVRFYHELFDASSKSKDGKSKDAQAKAKKKDDYVQKYLMKLGFMTKRKC